MSNPTVDAVIQEVTNTSTVIDSAIKLITGFHGMIDKAVQDALAGGATAEQLAPITDKLREFHDKTAELSKAVEANTPTTPAPVPTPSPGPVPAVLSTTKKKP